MQRTFACITAFLILMAHTVPTIAADADYELGHGLKTGDKVTLGGYFSFEYKKGRSIDEFAVDDFAFLIYGALSENLSYMFELEAVDLYKRDFENDTEETNTSPVIERLYGDYSFSDNLSFRIGKQITPIGYWNLQPINVLRETTSNPLLSYEMFPKFLTGADIYGYTAFNSDVSYHLYLQTTEDLDKEHLNIEADRHFGASLEQQLAEDWELGGSIGGFRETVDQAENRYIQFNTRLTRYRYTLSLEVMAADVRPRSDDTYTKLAAYTQGEYHFTPQHALIGRAEYYRNEELAIREKIGIIGYSYRPVYPVSLKAEYQWNSDSDKNQYLASFSVLF